MVATDERICEEEGDVSHDPGPLTRHEDCLGLYCHRHLSWGAHNHAHERWKLDQGREFWATQLHELETNPNATAHDRQRVRQMIERFDVKH